MTLSNRIDQSSHDYGYRDGGSDVERTLKMVASGVVGRENRAEVSLKSYVLILLTSLFSQFLECLLRSSFFDSFVIFTSGSVDRYLVPTQQCKLQSVH